jgi:hypothetical protein
MSLFRGAHQGRLTKEIIPGVEQARVVPHEPLHLTKSPSVAASQMSSSMALEPAQPDPSVKRNAIASLGNMALDLRMLSFKSWGLKELGLRRRACQGWGGSQGVKYRFL